MRRSDAPSQRGFKPLLVRPAGLQGLPRPAAAPPAAVVAKPVVAHAAAGVVTGGGPAPVVVKVESVHAAGGCAALAGTPAAKRPSFLIGRKPLHPIAAGNARPQPQFQAPAAAPPKAAPPQAVQPAAFRASASDSPAMEYYEVYFCKSSKKKHKNWDDAVLVKKGNSAELRGEEGQVHSKSTVRTPPGVPLCEGHTMYCGSFEVEVVRMISEDDYIKKGAEIACSAAKAENASPAKKPKSLPAFKSLKSSLPAEQQPTSQSHGAGGQPFAKFSIDPSREGACCLNESAGDGEAFVVVDPFIGVHLRPHQVKGVQFMFDSVMPPGQNNSINGCILADEMGLGKTLQTIALIWTLLKQSRASCYHPSIKKAMVVVPSSLVFNWKAEFKKWLGDQRLPVQTVSSGKSATQEVADFVNGSVKRVLIISYDLIRRHQEVLSKCSDIQLLVCDEGHRLKNIGGNQTISALQDIKARKRILLSGTPIQNNLDEFYAMITFIAPGTLGSPKAFKKQMADSIIKSRNKGCSEDEARIGRKRLAELNRRTAPLILRRTSEHIAADLPGKVELVVFCTPSSLQKNLYRAFLSDTSVRKRLQDPGKNEKGQVVLSLISKLSKILNHPELVRTSKTTSKDDDGELADKFHPSINLGSLFPEDYDKEDVTCSGKLCFIFALLAEIQACGDKVVIVSNYTTTLDVLGEKFRSMKYEFVRLDGSTDVAKRGDLVQTFNDKNSPVTIFLLSSKAGGVGLNLIGANRIILVDPCWNPATDLQAMARVWRFGQQKEVFIYRTISSGTIEERILQKQIRKGELEELVVEQGKANQHFNATALKNIFVLNETKCDTYDLLRDKDASPAPGAPAGAGCEVAGYQSFASGADAASCSGDALLGNAVRDTGSVVSFVLCKTHDFESVPPDAGGRGGGGSASCDSDDEFAAAADAYEELGGGGGEVELSEEEEEEAGGGRGRAVDSDDSGADVSEECVAAGKRPGADQAGAGADQAGSGAEDAGEVSDCDFEVTVPRKRKRVVRVEESDEDGSEGGGKGG